MAKTTVTFRWGGFWPPFIATAMGSIALATGIDLGWWWLALLFLAALKVRVEP